VYSGTITVRTDVPQEAQPEHADTPLQPPQLLQPQLPQAQAFAAESSMAKAGKMTHNRCFIKKSSVLRSSVHSGKSKSRNREKGRMKAVV
jgi:hypothetical protein